MLPWSAGMSGRLDEHVFESELLRGNPLDDPWRRPLWVYVPPSYEEMPDHRYPAVYMLHGYLGHVEMWRNRAPFRKTFVEAVDELFASGAAPPAIVVYVDAWTAYGGSQYLDSPGTGRYHSYLCDEIVPWVDRHYRTLAHRDHRGTAGRSSGGYGAMITPMLRPDLFGGLASHAGDALFDYTCVAKFLGCIRFLRPYDGDIQRWWKEFRQRGVPATPADRSLLILYGVSACFSARQDGTPEIPFDPLSGMLIPEVWQRWLDLDPVRMVPRYAGELRSMRGIWVDGGAADEHYLDLGAQAFDRALTRAGVREETVHYELFPGGHGDLDRRHLMSLDWLARRLAPDR
ncbi:alpha/beta hydrolase [Actinomadura livida]|uniref:Alpha/beta hydrolase-fold protein n=1 Tax=Actinomadura livida TaxID=79909 RepID=A0A7W7MYB0_9ACTN|nr:MULTISPECIES: alpha/beta hydrolase-fold protein [Actinomadura]MBB4774784.1 S-formylglutathione hydrolase FrmB [Actinomadura catellatispora]GGU06011.1 enterochelin esterase [Actinomadura livida]